MSLRCWLLIGIGLDVCVPEEKPAVRFCPDCKADYCGDCATSVHGNRTLSKHQLVDLSKKSSVMGPPVCQVHKTRHVDMYCLDCKVLLTHIIALLVTYSRILLLVPL